MNVKYMFDYVNQCKSENQVASWEGLIKYYNENKGVY